LEIVIGCSRLCSRHLARWIANDKLRPRLCKNAKIEKAVVWWC